MMKKCHYDVCVSFLIYIYICKCVKNKYLLRFKISIKKKINILIFYYHNDLFICIFYITRNYLIFY